MSKRRWAQKKVRWASKKGSTRCWPSKRSRSLWWRIWLALVSLARPKLRFTHRSLVALLTSWTSLSCWATWLARLIAGWQVVRAVFFLWLHCTLRALQMHYKGQKRATELQKTRPAVSNLNRLLSEHFWQSGPSCSVYIRKSDRLSSSRSFKSSKSRS